jgi:hypothetical protein
MLLSGHNDLKEKSMRIKEWRRQCARSNPAGASLSKRRALINDAGTYNSIASGYRILLFANLVSQITKRSQCPLIH